MWSSGHRLQLGQPQQAPAQPWHQLPTKPGWVKQSRPRTKRARGHFYQPSALCTGFAGCWGGEERGSPTEEHLGGFWVRVSYSSPHSLQGEGLLQREEEQQRPGKQQPLFTASNPVIPVTGQPEPARDFHRAQGGTHSACGNSSKHAAAARLLLSLIPS